MRLSRAAVAVLVTVAGAEGHAARDAVSDAPYDVGRIQAIVDDFKGQLSIAQDIAVSVVAANGLLVSVEREKTRDGAFRLTVDGAFVQTLNDDELHAVVAHELGHVWIFTNHPYLQTERLANRIAQRLVSRESLRSVYEKVWAHTGAKGDERRFLGE